MFPFNEMLLTRKENMILCSIRGMRMVLKPSNNSHFFLFMATDKADRSSTAENRAARYEARTIGEGGKTGRLAQGAEALGR